MKNARARARKSVNNMLIARSNRANGPQCYGNCACFRKCFELGTSILRAASPRLPAPPRAPVDRHNDTTVYVDVCARGTRRRRFPGLGPAGAGLAGPWPLGGRGRRGPHAARGIPHVPSLHGPYALASPRAPSPVAHLGAGSPREKYTQKGGLHGGGGRGAHGHAQPYSRFPASEHTFTL